MLGVSVSLARPCKVYNQFADVHKTVSWGLNGTGGAGARSVTSGQVASSEGGALAMGMFWACFKIIPSLLILSQETLVRFLEGKPRNL